MASLQRQSESSVAVTRSPPVSLNEPDIYVASVVPTLNDPISQAPLPAPPKFSASHSPKRDSGRPNKGEGSHYVSIKTHAKCKTPVALVLVGDIWVSGVDFMASKPLCLVFPTDKPMETGPVKSPGRFP
ncbi:Hypothetical predicted protein [Prunus dulcis]|uniref:Uncharacterized protein n=1 Tax=Prunus dulcis TaxID=3755 RepID=A0A5E4GEM0_PRUDU|nr:hypothetical protein L3X38_036281 [Prunus dulcis]VVA38275.1 Hypothetical predicted protein [Prunus dulcis]